MCTRARWFEDECTKIGVALKTGRMTSDEADAKLEAEDGGLVFCAKWRRPMKKVDIFDGPLGKNIDVYGSAYEEIGLLAGVLRET